MAKDMTREQQLETMRRMGEDFQALFQQRKAARLRLRGTDEERRAYEAAQGVTLSEDELLIRMPSFNPSAAPGTEDTNLVNLNK